MTKQPFENLGSKAAEKFCKIIEQSSDYKEEAKMTKPEIEEYIEYILYKLWEIYPDGTKALRLHDNGEVEAVDVMMTEPPHSEPPHSAPSLIFPDFEKL